MKKRALISVSDKSGVALFAAQLIELGYEIISTGGTFKALADAKLPVVSVSDVTGFPECLDGRVKTLHPAISAGVLAIRSNPTHMDQLEQLNISTIDIVVINLYPFKATVNNPSSTFEQCIENIDIGGPTLLRAAAKNHQDVIVVVRPSDYDTVISQLKSGGVTEQTKRKLAYEVFNHTAHYDALIADYLRGDTEHFSDELTLTYEKAQDMRYGENPHQKGVFYKECKPNLGMLQNCVQLHGKELSYNNINDTNGALELLKEFEQQACVVVVKHANPCGVGVSGSIYGAYVSAYEADPVSIFGGIIAANREIDANTAAEINNIFVEIVIAPSYSKTALEILCQKKNIRILQLSDIDRPLLKDCYEMKRVAGGLLIQERNTLILQSELTYPTVQRPTREQLDQLLFAFKVVKHTKSNGIVLAKGNRTTGIGPGQTNRITAAELAIKYAGEHAKGSVLASDAFFPFPDCVEAAAEAGISAIIQPGGSINDAKSIEACDKYKIPMVFTGIRHFKH